MPRTSTAVGGSDEFDDARRPGDTALIDRRTEKTNSFSTGKRTVQRCSIDSRNVVRAIIRIGDHLSSPAPLGERMRLLCREVASLLGCDASSIMLWDGEDYQAMYNWGNPPDMARIFESYRIPGDAPLMLQMEAADSFIAINDAAAHASMRGVDAMARVHSIVIAPMVDAEGRRLGFLTAEFNEQMGSFDDDSAGIVLGAARLAQAAFAADRDRRRRRADDLSRSKLLTSLVEAENRERRRIAHELHDDLVHRLYAMQLTLETAASQDEPSHLLDLEQLVCDAQEASNTLRRLLNDVHPTAIEDKSLGVALHAALQRKASTTGWSISIVDELTTQPTTATLTVLFRIALQALQNVAIHASASTVTAHLRTLDGGAELRITDDGCGFEVADVGTDRLGLISMSERASAARGRVDVVSSPGLGTEVTAWIPHG